MIQTWLNYFDDEYLNEILIGAVVCFDDLNLLWYKNLLKEAKPYGPRENMTFAIPLEKSQFVFWHIACKTWFQVVYPPRATMWSRFVYYSTWGTIDTNERSVFTREKPLYVGIFFTNYGIALRKMGEDKCADRGVSVL